MLDDEYHYEGDIYNIPVIKGRMLDRTPPEYLCGKWLKRGQCTLFYGDGGAGKSLFMAGLIAAIQLQKPDFLGMKITCDPLKVIYVDGELDQNELADRLFDSLDHIMIISRSVAGKKIQLHDVDYWFNKLSSYEFIVLDNKTCLWSLQDENLPIGWEDIIELLNRLKLAGCTVFLLHHPAKQTQGVSRTFRGSNVIDAIIDNTISVMRPDTRDVKELEKETRYDVNNTYTKLCFVKKRGMGDRDLWLYPRPVHNKSGMETGWEIAAI